jgi:hypothetical protein
VAVRNLDVLPVIFKQKTWAIISSADDDDDDDDNNNNNNNM